MTAGQKDTERIKQAAAVIIDGRDVAKEEASVLVTLEGLVALVLLATCKNDPRLAAGMLNEGLVKGVEERLALAASRRSQP